MDINGWTQTDMIAAYAAIVATGALALEVRRWFESGVRLKVDATGGMVVGNVDGIGRDERWVVVTVTNVGGAPVTLTTLGIRKFRTRVHWLFRRPTGHGVIMIPDLPGYPPSLPRLLNPGERWQGFVKQTEEISTEIRNEIFQVGIWCSDRNKGRLRRVFWRSERA